MIYVIACIVGLVIAGAATLALMSIIPSLEEHIGVLIFVFLMLWGGAIWLCQSLLVVGIIVGIIAFIVYIVKKRKPLNMENAQTQNQENSAETKTDSKTSEENLGE